MSRRVQHTQVKWFRHYGRFHLNARLRELSRLYGSPDARRILYEVFELMLDVGIQKPENFGALAIHAPSILAQELEITSRKFRRWLEITYELGFWHERAFREGWLLSPVLHRLIPTSAEDKWPEVGQYRMPIKHVVVNAANLAMITKRKQERFAKRWDFAYYQSRLTELFPYLRGMIMNLEELRQFPILDRPVTEKVLKLRDDLAELCIRLQRDYLTDKLV